MWSGDSQVALLPPMALLPLKGTLWVASLEVTHINWLSPDVERRFATLEGLADKGQATVLGTT